MTAVTTTPPALRWVALFLAACAALGLFLGFRDQMRKNPPGWYTGTERLAAPLPAAQDGIREAAPFDPDAPQPTVTITGEPAPKAPAAKADDAAKDAVDAVSPAGPPTVETPASRASPPPPPPKLKAAPPPAPKAPPSADPVGDILEGQKTPESAPTPVPY